MPITLDKALELLELAKDDPDAIDINDLLDAEDLGIEGLKRLQEQRSGTILDEDDLLPGESKVKVGELQ